ncbi:MAG: hypothetical protein ACM3N9_04250, partial [Syntrophothermus sp.]
LQMNYLLNVFQTTGIHLLLLFGPLLVLGFVMHYLSGWNERLTLRLVGTKGYYFLFAWLGTTVHELGHALFAMVFGHKIEEIKLFAPDPKTGTMGYVKHSWNRKNLYHVTGNFFIGMGPIILGTLILFLLFFLLYGSVLRQSVIIPADGDVNKISAILSAVGASMKDFFGSVFAGPDAAFWKTFLLIYCLFCIGGSVKLSPPDIAGAARGFLFIILIILIFNLTTLWNDNYILKSYTFLAAFLGKFYLLIILSLIINLFFLGILMMLNFLRDVVMT